MPKLTNILTPADIAELPDDTLIPEKYVLPMVGVSRTSWWRGVKSGVYPAPIQLGKRLNRWRLGTIRNIVRQAA